jgi:hypothetical protein
MGAQHNKVSFTLRSVEMECSFVMGVLQDVGNGTLIDHKMCVLQDYAQATSS